MSVRRSVLVCLVSLCGLAGGLVFGSAGALGALSFPFDGQLAPAGGVLGELAPNSVAVDDANGLTYVAGSGSGSGVVDVFETGSGAQVPGGLNGALTPKGSFGGGQVEVAANAGTGAVYVLDSTDGVVDVFESTGAFRCQISSRKPVSLKEQEEECNGAAGSEPEKGVFNGPGGIAVDQATGEVYVVDANNGVVDVFSAGGGYLRRLAPPGGFSEPQYARGIAVDDLNGFVYVADSGSGAVYVFNALGESEPEWTGANTPAGLFGGFLSVAADDVTGRVFVTNQAQGVVDVFEGSGGYLTQFGHSFGYPTGTAVDQGSGRVYVSDGGEGAVDIFGPGSVIPDVVTGPAEEVGPRGAKLTGTVNPDVVQLSDCHFDYVAEAEYNASSANPYGAGLTAPCVPAANTIPADSNVHAVSASIAGLTPGTTYRFRLQASNANGIPSFGSDATFATLPPPSIHDALAANITSTATGVSVDLGVRIDPGGSETTYHFEWGTSLAYGMRVPLREAEDPHIAAGTSEVPVTTHLPGLAANTTYHWRVVASNASGTTTGVDHVFVYGTTGAGGLPDSRAYEMVTPPYKNGALIGNYTGAPAVGVAESGSRVVAATLQCFAGAGSCTAVRQGVGSLYSFSRAAGSWVATSLAPTATRQSENNTRSWYSADAGTALFYMPTPPFGEDDFYARQPDGSFVDIGPLSPPAAGPSSIASAHVHGATADLSHIFFSNGEPGWPSISKGELLEYMGIGSSAPVLVGVSGGLGNTDLISACETAFGSIRNDGQGVLSADGRTVFFTARTCGSGTGANVGAPVPVDELFARIDNGEAGAHTVAVSQPSAISPVPPNHECETPPCVENTTNPARFRDADFVGASGDGSRVFFTDTQQLTDNASEDPNTGDSAAGGHCRYVVGVNGCNLYLYDFAAPVGRQLVSVSGDPAGGPRVQGVMAFSGDGSHVYFVARGVLSTVANGGGQVARDGAENLYVFERDAGYPRGRVVFIAVLPEADQEEWDGHGFSSGAPANVTPDGRFLVFTSSGALTADTTRTDGAQQVFRYDALTGALVRVSVGENGFNDNGNGGAGDASIVSGVVGTLHAGVARTDPTMSHDGAFVFFMSSVALTPGALNGVPVGTLGGEVEYAENVYEYHEGQVYLISDGRDTSTGPAVSCPFISAVCLLGVDEKGANVFFTTADRLVAQDTDTEVDIYDARVCTVGDPCIGAPSPGLAGCVGEGCHGVPAGAPLLAGAGSAVFSGAGNLAPAVSGPVVRPRALSRVQKLARALGACRSKRGRRRRVACEAQARRRYGARAGARSTSRRGGM